MLVTNNPPPKKVSNASVQAIVNEALANEKSEHEKIYDKCWATEEYRRYSPGEQLVDLFWETATPNEGQTLVDWGSGTGRMGYRLYKKGLDVTLVDFAEGSLDENIRDDAEDNDSLRFIKHDITKEIDLPSAFGVCTDVLEHIPEEDIDAVLDNILLNSRHVFLQISCVEDHFGAHPDIRGDKEKEHLHICVHDYQWWLQKLVDHKVIIHHSNDLVTSCIFYVTGYGSYFNLDNLIGQVNTPKEDLIENIKHAASLGIPSMKPCQQQDIEIMLLAGGPSLNDFEDEIIKNREDGMKLVTVNGSYNWAIERGLNPSLQCVIDSRDFNSRFTEQFEGKTDDTKYIVSSSAHPNVFDGLPKDRTFLWHVSLEDEIIGVIKEHFGKMYEDWFPAVGGCTVTLRALCALRMLGFHKVHVYGLDGCLPEGKYHHAYEQKENDKDLKRAIDLTVAGGTKYEKTFKVAPWMISQAQDFLGMVPRVLSDAKLEFYGDGLIPYMVNVAAELGKEVEISSK